MQRYKPVMFFFLLLKAIWTAVRHLHFSHRRWRLQNDRKIEYCMRLSRRRQQRGLQIFFLFYYFLCLKKTILHELHFLTYEELPITIIRKFLGNSEAVRHNPDQDQSEGRFHNSCGTVRVVIQPCWSLPYNLTWS